MKDEVQKDSNKLQLDVIRMSAVLGHLDIKRKYFHSGLIQQTIYVCPPQELGK